MTAMEKLISRETTRLTATEFSIAVLVVQAAELGIADPESVLLAVRASLPSPAAPSAYSIG